MTAFKWSTGVAIEAFCILFAVDLLDLDDRYRACYVGNRNRECYDGQM